MVRSVMFSPIIKSLSICSNRKIGYEAKKVEQIVERL